MQTVKSMYLPLLGKCYQIAIALIVVFSTEKWVTIVLQWKLPVEC